VSSRRGSGSRIDLPGRRRLSAAHTLSTKEDSSSQEVAYGRPVAFVRGQELRFPDFVLRLDRLVSMSLGHFGGHERFRTDYIFKIRGLGPTDTEHEAIWSCGYPGGLAPLRIELGRRRRFDGEIQGVSEEGGTITVSVAPPDAEQG
jgi:hypothetical protein